MIKLDQIEFITQKFIFESSSGTLTMGNAGREEILQIQIAKITLKGNSNGQAISDECTKTIYIK